MDDVADEALEAYRAGEQRRAGRLASYLNGAPHYERRAVRKAREAIQCEAAQRRVAATAAKLRALGIEPEELVELIEVMRGERVWPSLDQH